MFKHCEDKLPLCDPPKEIPTTSNEHTSCLEDTSNHFIDEVSKEGILALQEEFR